MATQHADLRSAEINLEALRADAKIARFLLQLEKKLLKQAIDEVALKQCNNKPPRLRWDFLRKRKTNSQEFLSFSCRNTGIPGKRKGSNVGKNPTGTKELIAKIPSEFLCMSQKCRSTVPLCFTSPKILSAPVSGCQHETLLHQSAQALAGGLLLP